MSWLTATILITARLKSTRLPQKALLAIEDRPLIGHLLDRLRRVKQKDRIVLCTSTLSTDAPLVDWARAEGISIFRGDPDDVLVRLNGAARTTGAHTLACVTGDNPLVCPESLDALLEFHWLHENDYSKTAGLPIGTYGYALSAEALERVCATKQETDTEIWGCFFSENPEMRCGTLPFRQYDERFQKARLTIDTPEDLELVRRIVKNLPGPTTKEIESLLLSRPEWLRLNAHVIQRGQDSAAPPARNGAEPQHDPQGIAGELSLPQTQT